MGLRLVDPGNYVQTGSSTGIVVLTLLKPTTVEFAVPEDSLPQIMARVRAGAKNTHHCLRPSQRENSWPRANLRRSTPRSTRPPARSCCARISTIRTKASSPSQFVNVVMLLDTLENVVTVPVAAVQRGAPGTYVYLVNEDNTVSVHAITLGAQGRRPVCRRIRLSPGDRVVTDGADRLRDGAKVTIPDTTHAQDVGTGKRPGGWRGTPGGGDTGSGDRPNRQRHRRPPQGDSPAPQDKAPQVRAPQDGAPQGKQAVNRSPCIDENLTPPPAAG